jgi:hypothetical protein
MSHPLPPAPPRARGPPPRFSSRFTVSRELISSHRLTELQQFAEQYFLQPGLSISRIRLRSRLSPADPKAVLSPHQHFSQIPEAQGFALEPNLQLLALDLRAHRHDSVLARLRECTNRLSPVACVIGLISAIFESDPTYETFFSVVLGTAFCSPADQPHFYHLIDEFTAFPATLPALSPIPADFPSLLKAIFDPDSIVAFEVSRHLPIQPQLSNGINAKRVSASAIVEAIRVPPDGHPPVTVVTEGFEEAAVVDETRDIPQMIADNEAQMAVTNCTRLLRAHPARPDLLAERAVGLVMLGKDPDALADADRVLALDDAAPVRAFKAALLKSLGVSQ